MSGSSSLLRASPWLVGLHAVLLGCAKPEVAKETAAAYWERAQSDSALEHGRQIWRANCRRCHARGIEGAPRLGDEGAWRSRASLGLETLTANALAGVIGKAGQEMPPRGGNPALADSDVRAAVAFMLSALDSKTVAGATP